MNDFITCPRCKYDLYHPEDIKDRWCPICEKIIPEMFCDYEFDKKVKKVFNEHDRKTICGQKDSLP
jgi:hypothetical protein